MSTNASKSVRAVFQCKPKRQTKIKNGTYNYLHLQDKIDVMKACGDPALILYEFYLSKSGTPDYTFDDESVARAISWNKSKVKKYRLKLTTENYFLQRKGKLNDGARITITYLDPVLIRTISGKNPAVGVSASTTAAKGTTGTTVPTTAKPTQSLFAPTQKPI